MEAISEVIAKKENKSLYKFMGLVDPEHKFGYEAPLIEAWNHLTREEQLRLYFYLLYRKWRAEEIYGEPYYIITNCHPYPSNWNGKPMLNRLMKEGKMVSAKHEGSYGIYTLVEAKVWQMTDVKPLNF